MIAHLTVMPCQSDRDRWVDAVHPDFEAQTLCRTVCPVRKACLEAALVEQSNGNLDSRVAGIWGGIFLPDPIRYPKKWASAIAKVRHTLQVVTQEVA